MFYYTDEDDYLLHFKRLFPSLVSLHIYFWGLDRHLQYFFTNVMDNIPNLQDLEVTVVGDPIYATLEVKMAWFRCVAPLRTIKFSCERLSANDVPLDLFRVRRCDREHLEVENVQLVSSHSQKPLV